MPSQSLRLAGLHAPGPQAPHLHGSCPWRLGEWVGSVGASQAALSLGPAGDPCKAAVPAGGHH